MEGNIFPQLWTEKQFSNKFVQIKSISRFTNTKKPEEERKPVRHPFNAIWGLGVLNVVHIH